MSVSGSEHIRRIKAQIDEIDPSAVRELAGESVALIDVRESGEWDSGHLPGAKHVPRGYLESRIDAQVPDRSQHVILYCASGQRSALAANTLQELGFEHVESMSRTTRPGEGSIAPGGGLDLRARLGTPRPASGRNLTRPTPGRDRPRARPRRCP